jgi:hypothetical protein
MKMSAKTKSDEPTGKATKNVYPSNLKITTSEFFLKQKKLGCFFMLKTSKESKMAH